MRKKLKIPTHIGIIMDGNGRWATRQSLPRNMGHKEGINAVERTIDCAIKYGVKYISVFAFSTENWKRSKEEINGIFDLVREYLANNRESFLAKGVKVTTMGDITKFPTDLHNELKKVIRDTSKNDKLTLNLALNYGGRADIVQAVNALIKKGVKSVTEGDISKALYSKNIPDPDFIIRTSGEMRVSNFMLYQMAYSEFYFPKIMWPDFNERQFVRALKEYSSRHRRYGGLK